VIAASATSALDLRYRTAMWSMLAAVMAHYIFFYAGRQNLGFAADGMQRELGYSVTTIAFFNSALLLGYGFGQAISGNLADLYGARIMVLVGTFLSVALNWMFSFTSTPILAATLWGLNGLAQSTAWPAMHRLLANWWPRQQRGTAVGFYLLSAGLSSSLTFALCLFTLQAFPDSDGWRWVFDCLSAAHRGRGHFFGLWPEIGLRILVSPRCRPMRTSRGRRAWKAQSTVIERFWKTSASC